jgi:multiple sugar transport system substrate-binding protein
MPIELAGITWNHTRGFLPMVATAQRFHELYPDIAITWHKRSLQAFADESLASLTEKYDLIVLDHPWSGFLARGESTLPIDEYLDLADDARNSVGRSHESYAAGGHQWALAIDAATPVSSWRPDLVEKHNLTLPKTWDDLIALADQGFVALPAIPIDTLMNFYMVCIGLGEEPFIEPGRVVSDGVGKQAIELLRDLISRCDPACVTRNPIQTYEAMTRYDTIAYCPFAYGYVNYTRPEYAGKSLQFGGLVSLNGTTLRSTLGGTGLAVSQSTRAKDEAISYLRFVASPEVQAGIYLTAGGQPAHRKAWLDPQANAWTSNFFRDTLPTLDNAFQRPTYDGAVDFQDEAGPVLHDHIVNGGSVDACLKKLNGLYQESTGFHAER